MPDASGYDIFIWGGSETVAKGGKHLAEQSGELERIMNEFSREVSSEKDLFDQSVSEMETQVGCSSQLLQEANYICSSRISEAGNAVSNEKSKWEDTKSRADNVLNEAKYQKDQLLYNIRQKKAELEGKQGELKTEESSLDAHKRALDNAKYALQQANKDLQNATYNDAAATAKGRIGAARSDMERANSDIQDDHKKMQQIQREIAVIEKALERLNALEGQFDAKITAAQNIVSQAQNGLDTANKHESQLNCLKDKANANSQKAAEANTADNNQLSAIRHDRKVSGKQLDTLQSTALNRQHQSTDMLAQECDVLQNVAERMALYEEFSFQ